MIPSAARAFERFFASTLAPAAGLLRVLALVALTIVLVTAVSRAMRATRTRRHGWETGPLVRCGECGLPAADPGNPRCPAGHPVRFPPGASAREARRRSGRDTRARWLAGSAVAAFAIAACAVAGAHAFRIVDAHAPPLAAIAGAAGFLFFAAALAGAIRASSPDEHRAIDRALSLAGAGAALVPAFFFLFLAHAADPPPPRAIGSLWKTPTALYVAHGERARREGAAAADVSADLITARSLVLGFTWTGLVRLSAGGKPIPWHGSGGIRARLLDLLTPRSGSDGALLAVTRSKQPVPTSPNVRVWILRTPDGIAFVPGEGDAREMPDRH